MPQNPFAPPQPFLSCNSSERCRRRNSPDREHPGELDTRRPEPTSVAGGTAPHREMEGEKRERCVMMAKDKALRYNAHIGFPPSQSAHCATLCQVFVLQDQLREERGMERKERESVCAWWRERMGGVAIRPSSPCCLCYAALVGFVVCVCARDCTWLSSVCEWTAA